MKIIHLIPSLSGGGAERQLALLANHQHQSGLEVLVVFTTYGTARKILLDKAVKKIQLHSSNNYDPRLLIELGRLVRRESPDVMQTWLSMMDVIGGLVAITQKVAWVISERNVGDQYRGGLKNRFRKLIGKKARAVVANTQAGLAYWDTNKASQVQRSIPNIVAVTNPEPISEKFLPNNCEFLVCCAGRMNRSKNQLAFISAMQLLLLKLPNACGVIFGTGEERAMLETRAASKECNGRVFVRDFTDNLPGWLTKANALVNVSYWEGSPNVALEAAAYGCPLVLSDIDGHRESFDGDSALFVNPKSEQELSDALFELHSKSEATNARVKNALTAVSKMSASIAGDKYRDVYLKIIPSKDVRMSRS